MAAIHCLGCLRLLLSVSRSISSQFPLTTYSIIVFNGFKVFTQTKGGWHNKQLTDFFTAYIGIPIFFILYAFWKIFKRSAAVNPAQADIWTGKAVSTTQACVPESWLTMNRLLMLSSGRSRSQGTCGRSSGSGFARIACHVSESGGCVVCAPASSGVASVGVT